MDNSCPPAHTGSQKKVRAGNYFLIWNGLIRLLRYTQHVLLYAGGPTLESIAVALAQTRLLLFSGMDLLPYLAQHHCETDKVIVIPSYYNWDKYTFVSTEFGIIITLL